MIALIQRVSRAQVDVGGETIAAIARGILVFVAVERGDGEAQLHRLWARVCGYRVFADARGRMNLNVIETDGEILLVPQFTLAADTDRGLRPSFSRAAPAELGRMLYGQFVTLARRALPGRVASGRFGADMQVQLTNDGPVTFWLRTAPG